LYPNSVSLPQQMSMAPVIDGASGYLTSATDINGSVATYGYDLIGRPVSTEQTATGIDRFVTTNYDDVNLVVTTKQDQVTRADHALVTTTYFDALGRVKKVVDAAGNTVQKVYGHDNGAIPVLRSGETTYELTSNPYTATSDTTMGWTLTSRQNGANCIGGVNSTVNGYSVRIQRFAGATAPSFSTAGTGSTSSSCVYYDGTTISGTDETNIAHTYSFDALGHMKSADGVTYGDDSLNNLTSAGTRSFTFGALSRLEMAQNPEAGTVNYYYDNNGNLVRRKDARGISTCFGLWSGSTCNGAQGYDGLNRLLLRTYSDSTPAVYFTYDSDVHWGC